MDCYGLRRIEVLRMARKKSELKLKYKKLVRDGKDSESMEVLSEVWKLCGLKKKAVIAKNSVPRAPVVKPKTHVYTQEELEAYAKKHGFKALKKIGALFGTTDRSIKNLIKEILEIQAKRLKQ